jgi:hypothetical protein
LLPLLADSNAMPIEKKLGILILFGAVAVFSMPGLFASASRLEKMAGSSAQETRSPPVPCV